MIWKCLNAFGSIAVVACTQFTDIGTANLHIVVIDFCRMATWGRCGSMFVPHPPSWINDMQSVYFACIKISTEMKFKHSVKASRMTHPIPIFFFFFTWPPPCQPCALVLPALLPSSPPPPYLSSCSSVGHSTNQSTSSRGRHRRRSHRTSQFVSPALAGFIWKATRELYQSHLSHCSSTWKKETEIEIWKKARSRRRGVWSACSGASLTWVLLPWGLLWPVCPFAVQCEK